MASFRRSPGALLPGVYHEIVSEALSGELSELAGRYQPVVNKAHDGDVDEPLVAMIREAVRIAIAAKTDAAGKLQIAEKILRVVAETGVLQAAETQLRPQLLRTLTRADGVVAAGPRPPRGSLLSSGLITNAQGESILDHLASEFPSADRIDLLCSFIKLSGLDRFREAIERHCAAGRPLRVLTTTYMRATDSRAVEWLHRMGAQIRVSYDDASTRLHAKAWIFHRHSDYATAYVGSSNLSHAAQTDGLEWNVRIARADHPDLVDEMGAVFETYWNDPDKFELFDGTVKAQQRLVKALSEPVVVPGFVSFDLEPKSWQKPILRELEQARAVGRQRNLVVAATGTGKTLIAAFDYAALQGRGEVHTLLFVAHRREILEQARQMFSQALRRPHFGELWVDGRRPTEGTHVFASIQSLANAALDPSHFDHVIIDEVHHAAAGSYDALLNHLRPKQLVGLTATPERADGRVYEHHFPRPYVGNLRLWNAIPDVLVPFRYFVLDTEGVDLSDVQWRGGGYVDSEVSRRLVTAADLWIRTVARALAERIAQRGRIRALAFCVDKAHAQVVADRLSQDTGLPARVLTDATPSAERRAAKDDLLSGKVQVLCVVDLFNEGVDIPDVNTLFLFRPTESATIFIQQLGRGLRRSRDKDILTVFDLTGRQHPRFRFDRHLRGLLGHTPRELREFVQTGLGRLPSGCTVAFEERSREEMLQSLRRAIPSNVAGLRDLLAAHRDEGWDLKRFLDETEVELGDLYRQHRSWTTLRADVGLATLPDAPDERAALSNVRKLLHVGDPRRLDAWERLVRLEIPTSAVERRLAAMLFVILHERFPAAALDDHLARWRQQHHLRDELAQLIPVLRQSADHLPRDGLLPGEIPLVMHARYLNVELSAAFHAVTRKDGRYRNLYTGVEAVCDGRYDLLLVTLDKRGVAQQHLRFKDYPINEQLFHWQSQSETRQDDNKGRRHLRPLEAGVQSLLLVRETQKDERGATAAFRYLGPVSPQSAQGERPISVEWRMQTPLKPEWVRRWASVT
jgi:superfamily II DNA or RNA helicase/HKD family nuclease